MPPTGRIKNPTPNVAMVSSNAPYSVSVGKNSREMMTVRNPNTTKSYHSSALPITTAAIWSGFDAARFVVIGLSVRARLHEPLVHEDDADERHEVGIDSAAFLGRHGLEPVCE